MNWFKIYWSPFKFFFPKFYIGKIRYGTPYFFPRRWIKNKENGGRHSVEKTIGFDFVGLGWKTKWDTYRHEWSPIWSFVFFKWQIAIIFLPPHQEHYWECWLYYVYDTDKTKSKKERIEQCKKENPCVWIVSNKGKQERIDYYPLILKSKYNGNR